MLAYLIEEDHILASFIAGLRSPALTSIMGELTKLGDVWVAGAIAVVVACFLIYKKEIRSSVALMLCYLGSAYTVALIKDVVMRARHWIQPPLPRRALPTGRAWRLSRRSCVAVLGA